MEIESSVSIRTRSSLASSHFQNSNLFKDKAKEIEALFKDEESSDIPKRNKEDHTAFCFGSIQSIVSFLEAQANEFIENIREDNQRIESGGEPQYYPNIKESHRTAVVSAPEIDKRVSNASPPVKFNVLLDIVDLDQFDRNDDPLEPVLVLNRLRNELTHYTPEWVKGGHKEYTENEYGFEEDLQGRYQLNPLYPGGNAFFPDQCLSYGCTEWAIRYSRALVFHFGQKMGVEMRAIQV